MTITKIPRVKAGYAAETITPNDPLSLERLRLADKAQAILGYSALKADVMGKRLTDAATDGPLTIALLQLGMDVLDTAHVIDYQLAEASRLTRDVIIENFKQWTVGWITAATWQHTVLSSYRRPVPEFVIDKAIRIKEACPTVLFYVQHLNLPKADPFLIAAHGDEIYYIDAWDEPRFESSL